MKYVPKAMKSTGAVWGVGRNFLFRDTRCHIYIYVGTHLCTYTYVCVYAYMCACLYVRLHKTIKCMWVRTSLHTPPGMYTVGGRPAAAPQPRHLAVSGRGRQGAADTAERAAARAGAGSGAAPPPAGPGSAPRAGGRTERCGPSGSSRRRPQRCVSAVFLFRHGLLAGFPLKQWF